LNIKSFTNNTNNIKRNNAKYTKPTVSFPELGAGHQHPASSCRTAPEGPGLASSADRTGLRNARIGIWIRITGRTSSRVLFKGWPWTKKSETLVIPQL